MPHIRFLFVRLAVCYRLPSSIRCLLDSAELLVLPATGRTVDFHHTITRALPGAPKKARMSDSYHSFRPNKAGPKHLTTFLTHFGGIADRPLRMTAGVMLTAASPQGSLKGVFRFIFETLLVKQTALPSLFPRRR